MLRDGISPIAGTGSIIKYLKRKVGIVFLVTCVTGWYKKVADMQLCHRDMIWMPICHPWKLRNVSGRHLLRGAFEGAYYKGLTLFIYSYISLIEDKLYDALVSLWNSAVKGTSFIGNWLILSSLYVPTSTTNNSSTITGSKPRTLSVPPAPPFRKPCHGSKDTISLHNFKRELNSDWNRIDSWKDQMTNPLTRFTWWRGTAIKLWRRSWETRLTFLVTSMYHLSLSGILHPSS
jgi:hypothetical protein